MTKRKKRRSEEATQSKELISEDQLVEKLLAHERFHGNPFVETILSYSRRNSRRSELPSLEIGIYQGIPYGLLFLAKQHIMYDPIVKHETAVSIYTALEKAGIFTPQFEFNKEKNSARIEYKLIGNEEREILLIGDDLSKHSRSLDNIIKKGIFSIINVIRGNEYIAQQMIEQYGKLLVGGGFYLSAGSPKPPKGFALLGQGCLGDKGYHQLFKKTR